MWGHWTLWNHGGIDEAERHFSSALESGREKGYVRDLQLSALLNCNNDACDEELVRVLNAIRKEQGSIGPEMAHQIFSMYYRQILPSGAGTARFVNAVPPAEHVATFKWVFERLQPDDSQKLLGSGYLSVLQEAAGQRDEALEGYRSVQRQTVGRPGSLSSMADAGIKRILSRR
jgi:hypothetical protein